MTSKFFEFVAWVDFIIATISTANGHPGEYTVLCGIFLLIAARLRKSQ